MESKKFNQNTFVKVSLNEDKTVVELTVDSRLPTCRPLYVFDFDFGTDQQKAYLIAEALIEAQEKYLERHLSEVVYHATPKQLSKLKRILSNWSIKKEEFTEWVDCQL